MAAFVLIVVHTSHTALYFTLSMLLASVLSFASILPSPCNFPFLGSSAFCSPPNTSRSPINDKLTCLQTTTFEQLQEHASGTTSLAIMLRKMSAISIPAMIHSIDESNVISKEPIKASLTRAFEKVEHQHLLSEFWTMLGGNRGRLAEYNEDIRILDAILKVEGYYMEGVVEVGFILDATSKDVVRLKLAFDEAVVSGKSFAFAGSAQGLVESVKHLLEFHAHFSRTQR
ncbi:hypothetical protein M422DRAFT_267719, partial [Sphaerobolus stellatus SS14]